MNATLRDALHGLAPEPPDDLGLPGTARRRAGALRRRRVAAGGTAVVTAFALVVAGNAVLTGSGERTVAPTAGSRLVGAFPDWPRRGDTPGLDDQATRAWRDHVRAQGAIASGTPRVLYAGAALAVVHGTVFPGGDRLALVTFDGGHATVRSDSVAPLPGTGAISILLGTPPEAPVGADACDSADDPAHVTRLLVLAAPGVEEARWRVTGPPGIDCGPGMTREGAPWRDVPLSEGGDRASEGTALFEVPYRDGHHVEVEVTGSGGARIRGEVAGIGPPSRYPGLDRMRDIPTPLGWNIRTDYSRAEDVAANLPLPAGVRDAERCELELARSLPDGTAVVFCTVPSVLEGDTAGADPVFVADDSRGRFRTYVLPRGVYSGYATVVEGRTGRWLVYVDRPDQETAALVQNGVTSPIPLEHGTGFLMLGDGEVAPGAMVTTPDFGPGGGQAVTLVEGREVERR